MEHVFCFGPNKTATNSIVRALYKLGWGAQIKLPWNFLDHFVREIDGAVYLFDFHKLITPTVLSDIFPARGFEGVPNYTMSQQFRTDAIMHFLKTFPKTHFIFNIRDITSWLRSRKKHVTNNINNPEAMAKKRLWKNIDINGWVEEYAEYLFTYTELEKKTNVLWFEASTGMGYKELCAFLGKEEPNVPFPYLNTDGE